MRRVLHCLALSALVLLSTAASAAGEVRDRGNFDRFIVMFKPGVRNDAAIRQRALDAIARTAGASAREVVHNGLGAAERSFALVVELLE